MDSPSFVSSSARAKWPRQYTMDSARMVLYLPKKASAMIAPSSGKKYTAEVKVWYHCRASSSPRKSGLPDESSMNLVMKTTRMPFMP